MIIVWIACGLTGALCIAVGCVMLTGRGASLIAGYNTMSREEKEKANYDEKALCKFMGKIMTAVGFLTFLLAAGIQFGFTIPIVIIFHVGVIGLSIFAVIYGNTGNRFKK